MRVQRSRVHDLTELVGEIFRRQSGKRKYRILPNGCFEWLGWKDKDGYGGVSYENETTRVHRLVYKICVGPLQDHENIRHTCDYPACINPAHLVKGSQQQNVRDKVARERQARGAKISTNKLTEDDVREIRRLLAAGMRQVDIAALFNITQTNVSKINVRNSWSHI